jgi:hypothetical protein
LDEVRRLVLDKSKELDITMKDMVGDLEYRIIGRAAVNRRIRK